MEKYKRKNNFFDFYFFIFLFFYFFITFFHREKNYRSSIHKMLKSDESIIATPIQKFPSKSHLQKIIQYAKNLPTITTAAPVTVYSPIHTDPDPWRQTESQTDFELAVCSLDNLRNYIVHQLVDKLQMTVTNALKTATYYVETLVNAEFDYITLRDTIINFAPSEPNIEGEPEQTVYSHLLDHLRLLSFEKYPKSLLDSNLDSHLTNIARISLDYFMHGSQTEPCVRPDTGFINSKQLCHPPSEQTVQMENNTTHQLPQYRYILVSVSVDTVPVESQIVVWQISVHIPSLPDNEDPDYECLMLPQTLQNTHPKVLTDLGFVYDKKQMRFYHQGAEFGRRKADPEDVSIEKFINYLIEIRSGLHGAGFNNGLVLLFETAEDLALVQQLFYRHRHDIFLDVVKGITCLEHYLRILRPARSVTYSWPSYQYRLGETGRWSSNVSNKPGSALLRIEAETKPECIYNICQTVLNTPPVLNQFMMWDIYLVNHNEINNMVSTLQYILELLPLQNHIDHQLFMNRIPIVLEGIYSARSEAEAAWPHKACARQTIRRLVFLGFTWNVLKKCFEADPTYEIPDIVFLQDMSEAQRLRVHRQTDHIRHSIKQYFLNSKDTNVLENSI
jgi:hypothetical protein